MVCCNAVSLITSGSGDDSEGEDEGASETSVNAAANAVAGATGEYEPFHAPGSFERSIPTQPQSRIVQGSLSLHEIEPRSAEYENTKAPEPPPV